MDAFAQHDPEEREGYFVEAAARLRLTPPVVEKDFWVCWTLKRLFALDCVAGNLLFKGGTSLSKVYSLIQRFSEDVDLSIHRTSLGFGGDTDPANPDLSGKARKRQDEALGEAARVKIDEEIQPELESAIAAYLGESGWSLMPDSSDPDGQSLAFAYPPTRLTPQTNAYIKPTVKIEFGARSDHWPAETRSIESYVSQALSEAIPDGQVSVRVMEARRTFWEKATILHQMAHLPEHRAFPPRYSRHYCDLAAMVDANIVDPQSDEDDDLLVAVVAHKMTFYRSAWASYPTAVRGTLRLIPQESRIPDLRGDLQSMTEMFLDRPPELEAVLDSLQNWEVQFNQYPNR